MCRLAICRFLTVAVLTVAAPAAVEAQVAPEVAGAFAAAAKRCGDAALVDELARRYADNPAFDDEMRFRKGVEPDGLSRQTCEEIRELVPLLSEIQAPSSVDPSPRRAGKLQRSVVLRRVFSVPAGSAAARSLSCALPRLAARLLDHFAGDADFEATFLVTQRRLQDDPRALKCNAVELSARNLLVSVQMIEHDIFLPTTRDRSRIHCLLPGLRLTTPMTADDCHERRGKAYDAFTRVDEDYAPGLDP